MSGVRQPLVAGGAGPAMAGACLQQSAQLRPVSPAGDWPPSSTGMGLMGLNRVTSAVTMTLKKDVHHDAEQQRVSCRVDQASRISSVNTPCGACSAPPGVAPRWRCRSHLHRVEQALRVKPASGASSAGTAPGAWNVRGPTWCRSTAVADSDGGRGLALRSGHRSGSYLHEQGTIAWPRPAGLPPDGEGLTSLYLQGSPIVM